MTLDMTRTFLNEPFFIGKLQLDNRLIQGPLAGYSCAPFRKLFHHYHAPAYCVSEMISAHDVLYKHALSSRYLVRDASEKKLCYQISGRDPLIMARAAAFLQEHGADLIDLNCGCPKTKIRKKGTGSALLEEPDHLQRIIRAVRQAITIPLTVKIRIQATTTDLSLVRAIEQAGADAIIVHGRRWIDDYDVASDFERIGLIKQAVTIPVIANGDIADQVTLSQAIETTQCDAFMIARAGCGHPWLYQQFLSGSTRTIDYLQRVDCFISHLQGLAILETEYQAVLQSKSLVRYYFKTTFSQEQLCLFYSFTSLAEIERFCLQNAPTIDP